VQITALDPRPINNQLELFTDSLFANNLSMNNTEKRGETNAVTDAVNHRYGEFTLAPARLLNRSDMPNVIAPAWKPFGHRQTIQDTAADVRHSQQQSQQRAQYDKN
jgi:DNA polymerase-4